MYTVISVDEIECDEIVYDIEIENTHCYFADGILVHNCDGARCHMSLIGGKAVAFSRNGKPIELRGQFDAAMMSMLREGETLDGELLAYKNGKVLDRKTGNGIVNKAVRGAISEEEAKMLKFATWDIVDFTSTIPYNERIERLTKLSTQFPDGNIYVLATTIVKNEEEAQAFYQECIDAGEEGAMLKNANSVWEPKRTKNLGKMKGEEVADLEIVAVNEGTGRNEGRMGAFTCQTRDGKLVVNVGTGFSDDDRDNFYTDDMLGKIIEVQYNQLINSKGKDTYSLFLPRFLSVRVDKDVANSLGELK